LKSGVIKALRYYCTQAHWLAEIGANLQYSSNMYACGMNAQAVHLTGKQSRQTAADRVCQHQLLGCNTTASVSNSHRWLMGTNQQVKHTKLQ
jgi:hypothetical protein